MEIDCTEDNDSVILVSGEEHRQEGTRHYKKGDYVAALQCYTAAIDTEPEVASYYNNRSATYIMLSKYNLALQDAKRCVELESDNTKYLNRLAKCELLHGNWNMAENIYNKVISLESSNNEAQNQLTNLEACRSHYQNYQTQLEKEDYRHSLYCVERMLELSPASDELHLLKIGVYIYLKKYPEAKLLLENIIQNSNSPQIKTEGLYYRGLIFYYMGHSDKATEHFQHVLQQNPDHIDAQKAFRRIKNLRKLKDTGNHHIQRREFNKAEQIYTEALEIDPKNDSYNAVICCNRAYALMNQSKHDEALKDCDRAIRLDGSYDRAKCRRVTILMRMEKWQEAIKEAEKLQKTISSDEVTSLLREAKSGLKRAGQMNPYKILDVDRNSTESEIKKAYKKLSLKHHPDRHPHETEEVKKMHEVKFKELNAAYSVLSDAKKKQMYDSGADIDDVLGNSGGMSGFNNERAHEMFQAFFTNSGGGGGHGGHRFTYHFG